MRVSELSCRLWVFPFAHEALARAGVGGGRIKNLGNNTDFVAKCPTGARFILRHAKIICFEKSKRRIRRSFSALGVCTNARFFGGGRHRTARFGAGRLTLSFPAPPAKRENKRRGEASPTR